MDTESALAALAALAHPTRLATFRLLVRHAPEGLSTGTLVEAAGLSQSTLSTHLAVLVKAGLVSAHKQGRQQIQRAEISAMSALMLYLVRDCCDGRADLCAPLLETLSCCAPAAD
ncbi:helix-turn-helix transcriptional regulator [Novosphingobium sp. YJ-S2-02]|uniref:Helix-turn-helix transcriptional regulator n=1 Tax=Novosphingobium aureum TaxID=2792964 RepID=A0A931MKB3_9SPHN|nr:metalloregulator ArsR/SmtB family transcription factor [Novosphingobium aureum]MBH0112315.1 helix-turn-helix transcriptional regulator [Novosphingobium aureum]